ncbi:MAG: NAD(P)-dependent oxidoreductase [Kiritimatiellae bacterium]|nr:NAD(P)-dependent oxidoreductase [Kiritimatiellia bacterium]
MKVAIIGSKGLLGADLCAACRRAGMGVVELAREQMDVTQPAKVRQSLPPVPWVINCASFSDVEACEKQRAAAFAVNSEGARALAVSCARRGIRLMHISCAGVFDGRKATPFKETDEPNPLNAHGLSKLAGEKAVRAEGGKSLIVRLPSLFGWGGQNIPAGLFAALQAKQLPLKVPAEEIIAPAYSRHVAEGLVKLLSLDATGVVHVGPAGRCTWKEFAQVLADRISPGAPIEEVPMALYYPLAERPMQTVLDSQRYRQWTGHALPGWHQGLEAWLSEAKKD